MNIENMSIAEYRKLVGKRIEYLRIKNGMQKVELAKKVGVVAGNIYNYEVGKAAPQPHTIVRMADVFHTTTDYILCRTDTDTIL